MRKDALTITITTVVLGIFGAFFRWLQNINAFEADTGLAKPFAGTAVAFVIYAVAAAAVLGAMMLLWLRHYEYESSAALALRTKTVLPAVISWVLCAAAIMASLVLMFTADACRAPGMQRLFAALGIFAGAALPFIPGTKGSCEENPMGSIASVILVAYSCLWLVFSYRIHSENPVVWAYAVEILAISATIIAFYYISAFFYGRAKPKRALFMVQLAAFLDLTTLSDSRSVGESAAFAVAAAMLILLEYMLITNLREKE